MSRSESVELVKATAEHIPALVAGMREADREEIWAAAGWGPTKALEYSLRVEGADSYCILADGVAVAVGGLAEETWEKARVWAVGTDWIATNGVLFTRICKGKIEEWRTTYSLLYNFVDDRNVLAKKWLWRMGFRLLPPVRHGYLGIPFRLFVMTGET